MGLKKKKSKFEKITTFSGSEEHTSELQSPVPSSYAVFCLKKKSDLATHFSTRLDGALHLDGAHVLVMEMVGVVHVQM